MIEYGRRFTGGDQERLDRALSRLQGLKDILPGAGGAPDDGSHLFYLDLF